MEVDIAQRTLKEVIGSADPLVNELIVEFNDDELHTAGVDPSNVAMVDIELSEDAFDQYDGDSRERGINLERLSSIIGMAGSDDIVHMEDTDDDGKVLIEFGELSYTLGLIGVDNIREGRDIPELDWEAELSIPASKLKQGKNACTMVSDHFTLAIADGTMKMSAEGDTDSTELNIEPLGDDADDDEEGLRFDGDPEDCSTMYSLDYMDGIIDAVPKGGTVELRFGDGLPVVLEFDIADGAGRVAYVVAPRVET